MADLSTIQKAFDTKQSFDIGSLYKGASRVGFEGDQATLAGQKFSSPEALYAAITGGGSGSSTNSRSSGSSQTSSSITSFEDSIKRALELQREAIKPAVESLRGGIPETQQAYAGARERAEAQIDPLKERYQNLLAEVKSTGQEQAQRQTRITSGELGKRGLVGSSTLAQQELESAVRPIEQSTQRLAKDVELSREEGIAGIQERLAGLTTEETQALRTIQNAIAQLQSGAAQGGIATGTSLYQTNAQQQLAQQEAQRQAEQQAIENALQQRMFEEVTLPTTQYQINQPYYKPETGSSGLTVQDFLSQFGGGYSQPEFESTGFSNVDKLLAQGKFDEARQLLLNP
jgi:hypothetical protein